MRKTVEDKTKTMLMEYEKFETLVNSLSENVRCLRLNLEARGKVLQEIRKSENSRPEKLKPLIPEIQKMLKALNYKYDDKLVCDHFGVNSEAGIFDITMSERDGKVQIVLQVKDQWVAHKEVGLSKRAWNRVRKLFREKYGITHMWNGGEGFSSMSMVLKRKAPKSLSVSLENYSKRSSKMFGFPRCNFEKHFIKNLKEVKKER